MITFKPKQITKKLLATLPDRARDVLEKRYGLGKSPDTHTLESIGQTYGITRERVRQIENYGIQSIQKSDLYTEHEAVFEELRTIIDSLGCVISEKALLDELSQDRATRNHIYFLLVLGDPFYRSKENSAFYHRWYTKRKVSEIVEKALQKIYASLDEHDLISEDEILPGFASAIKVTALLRPMLNISSTFSKRADLFSHFK